MAAHMKLGLHIGTFTWDGGPTKMSSTLAELATLAEDVGFENLTVMDHVWQIAINGPKEWDMLEGYTALGYLAAITKRVRLMTLVTGVTYRSPGLLAKEVTTLDVLSNGRAALGIGAGWNAEEAAGLGLGFAPRPSVSRCSRRRCRSACRCGRTTTDRTRASTTSSRAR